MRVRKVFRGALAILLASAWWGAASGQVTTGALIECLATFNPAAPSQWANLGSSGGAFDHDVTGDPPALDSDPDLTAYYDMNGASWGNGPGTTPTAAAESMTVDIWMRQTSYPTAGENHLYMLRGGVPEQRNGIFLRHNNEDGDADHKWVSMELRVLDDEIGNRCFIGPNVNSDRNIYDLDLPVPLNEWFHLAVVVDDATSCIIYSNGVAATPAISITQDFDLAKTFDQNSVGLQNHLEQLSRSLRGHINTFRVYDRALSPAEIAANHAAGPAKAVPLAPVADATGISVIPELGSVTFTTQVDRTYFLQSTTNPPNWSDTGARIDGTGGTVQLYDPDGFSTQKTYRVVEF
jgi:hypothetical protein